MSSTSSSSYIHCPHLHCACSRTHSQWEWSPPGLGLQWASERGLIPTYTQGLASGPKGGSQVRQRKTPSENPLWDLPPTDSMREGKGTMDYLSRTSIAIKQAQLSPAHDVDGQQILTSVSESKTRSPSNRFPNYLVPRSDLSIPWSCTFWKECL